MRFPICTVGIEDAGALWLGGDLSRKYAAIADSSRPKRMAVKSNFFMTDQAPGD
jgi:hypothetical protein